MKCSSNLCSQDAVVHVTEVRNSRALSTGQLFCEGHANVLWESYLADSRVGGGSSYKVENAARFEPELILGYQREELHRVLLREVGGSKLVFLPVAYPEFCILYQAVQDSPYKEISLYVAMARVIKQLGAELPYVIIDGLHPEGYFIAKAVLVHNKKVSAVQIRPSDGLALALFVSIPFLVAEGVLTKIKETGQLHFDRRKGDT